MVSKRIGYFLVMVFLISSEVAAARRLTETFNNGAPAPSKETARVGGGPARGGGDCHGSCCYGCCESASDHEFCHCCEKPMTIHPTGLHK